MAKNKSAGLLVYRLSATQPEVLLVHPGGPFWAKKDAGVWGIPKGEFEPAEDPLVAARREFAEELGQPAPAGLPVEIGEVKRRDGRPIVAWAVEGDMDAPNIKSNTISIDWPPKSGQKLEIPEVDRAQWFSLDQAALKIHDIQLPFLQRLAEHLKIDFN